MSSKKSASSVEIARHKHFLRGYYRHGVLSMTARERRLQSSRIVRRLQYLPQFRTSKIVALYISRPDEVDTRPILSLCRKMGKTAVVPIVFPENHRMIFAEWPSGKSQLRRNVYGLWEPSPKNCRVVADKEIDLIIAPGRAFAKSGDRLGSGGGFYDRFVLRLPRTPRIGLAFNVQLAVRLPRVKYDQRMKGILTAEKFYRAG